jgi:hypothetical protein
MKYTESNISNIHSNPETHNALHNSHTGNRVLTFKTVCRQQICESATETNNYTAMIKHESYYYANKNMSTEYIYSQISDKYNTKFRQPKSKRLVQRQDRPPKFVSCKLDTQEEGSQKM